MGARVGGRARQMGVMALVAAAILAAAVAMGVLSVEVSDLAPMIALVVLAIGLMAVDPIFLIALSVPATLLMTRVGGVLSVSDVVLAMATALALIVVPRAEFVPIRPLIWAGIAYLATSLPTTVLNPYSANIIEWVHEVFLVVGSMVVGLAIGRYGGTGVAVGGYVLACVGIAIVTTVVAFSMLVTRGEFGPVYLPMLHKNLIGGALAVALVILYGRPAWFRWPTTWTWIAAAVCGVGILASGARQGMVGAMVGVLVIALRRDPVTGKRRLVPWILAIPVTVAVFTLVNDQLSEDNPFNSAYQRLDWYEESIKIWLNSPVFGVGLRWWYTGEYAAFQPPNAELEVLTSVGVVGLIGFLAMFVIGFWALWRIDPAYGTVGAAVVATRFTQGQFDLYWVAGQASLLWIIAGICFGAKALDEARQRNATDTLGPVVQTVRGLTMLPGPRKRATLRSDSRP
ncbi:MULTISPECIES: O-antigen ligase family protein [Microbacterium]|uniref:O-antigen ligase family protein n=1 Tax=uncultured Microbacterium sp. TaxID=191216 RepID=UPI002639A774|nr:O-antigen ligase family protein [uncultured Microbacterium sp.]